MKTLFINLYKDRPSSYSDTEVFNAEKDNILDGFYISLGMAIAEGIRISDFKSLVIDFASEKPIEYESFENQWEKIKNVLLGDNPKGEFVFQLSPEYLEWLKINDSSLYYQKYKGMRKASVKLDIEELYEDTVDAIRRKVIRFLQKNDNYKNYDKFVVNDIIVNDGSNLVCAINEMYKDNLVFITFEKWKEITKEEKNNIIDEDSSTNKECTTNTEKECKDSPDQLNLVVGLVSEGTVMYMKNGETHFDTCGNKVVQFCRYNGLFLDTVKYIPMVEDRLGSITGEGNTFAFLAINTENDMLCKVDTYGITSICDYSNGKINNGSHYDGELSKYNYSRHFNKIVTRVGDYLLLESSDGHRVIFEDKKDKVVKIDINLDKINTSKNQSYIHKRLLDTETKCFILEAEAINTIIHNICCKHGTWGYIDINGDFHDIPFARRKYPNARIFSSNLIILSNKDNFDHNSTKCCSLYNIKNRKILNLPNLHSGQIYPLNDNYFSVRYWNDQEKAYFNNIYMTNGTLVNEYQCNSIFIIE